MPARRVERVNGILKECVAGVIAREIKDPRVAGNIIGVTRVSTTPDLKYAKVYVSIFAEPARRAQILSLLAKASGFIRKNAAAQLTTRFTPEIIFELDESLDHAMHIEAVLKEINAGGSGERP